MTINRTILKTLFLSLPLALVYNNHINAESFSDYMNSQRPTDKQEFQQFKSDHEVEFEAYKKALQDAFNTYKNNVATVWGKNNAVIPGKKTDVSYQDKLKQRSIIDFESGQINVDIALTPDEARDPRLVQKKMQQALQTTLKRGTDPRSIIDIASNPSQTRSKGRPVLQGLVSNTDGQPLQRSQEEEFIRQQSQKLSLHTTRGTDNQPRVIVSTTLAMIPERFRIQAQRYRPMVKKYSAEMNIPSPLVYAIIETESAFNPNARSAVPAFGLMQLVPTSGARDAYRLLFKKDRVVTDRYLYNPDNNIKLGTAFIHKVYYDYLPGIKNVESRTWATIAAYNTGAGNVLATFAGKYRRSKFGNRSNWKKQALSIINRMSAEQVYQHLKRNLPYAETQRYIQKIRTRIPQYQSI